MLLYVVLASTCYHIDRSTDQVYLPGETVSLNIKILYLTQTEKCLPVYLKSPEVIGNTTACQCDVLVLSYKEECKDTSLPHVKYIFQPSTTWNTGRNLLYDISKARDKFYLYYIFMDDDVKLRLVETESDNNVNPWRMFEDSLTTIQPPIAVVDSIINFVNVLQPKHCEIEHVTKLAQVFWFDAIFNAFHCHAVNHILPYPTKFDNRSWFYSQMYAIIRADVKFHGATVGDARLKAVNSQHRPYPKEMNWADTFKIVADEVRQEIPEKYRDKSEPILQQWMQKNVKQKYAPGEFFCSRAPKPNTVLSHIPYKGYQ